MSTPETRKPPTPEHPTIASLQWLEATHPACVTPITLERGGPSQITFRDADGAVIYTCTRNTARYRDGSLGLQDEIYHGNTSSIIAQYNYEFNAEGALTKHPVDTDFSPKMGQAVADIAGLVRQAGSTITADPRDYNREAFLISNGKQWIDHNSGLVISPPLLILAGPTTGKV